MSAAERIAQASVGVVVLGPRLHFRIRQIDSALVLEAGGAFLLAARPQAQGEGQGVSLKSQVQGRSFMTIVAAAGTTDVSVDGGLTWESCRIVRTKEEEDLPANAMHETSLPPGTVIRLGTEILKFSTDGGAAASRLASFL